ncbi:MAG TPA: hypothetical protein VLH56_03135 [Dissulfurispiraceae bacterium]|nr:hypothetical protein [Dissulfurispiraceae bacterium]
MDEEKQKQIAVFRFAVISGFVGGRMLERGETEKLMKEKCAKRWQIPGSVRTHGSESENKEWILRDKASGGRLESLYPRKRSDKGKPRAIEQDTAMGIISLTGC